MQISRHWRLNPVRYRLEGFVDLDGVKSLQDRPSIRGGLENEGYPLPNEVLVDLNEVEPVLAFPTLSIFAGDHHDS